MGHATLCVTATPTDNIPVKVALEDRTEFYTRPRWQSSMETAEIRITTDITGMVDAAENALMELPGPILYERAKIICRIAPAGQSPKWLQRPPDARSFPARILPAYVNTRAIR